jgi:hypothetical protein
VSEVDGIKLHLSPTSVTGYRGVSVQSCHRTPFYVRFASDRLLLRFG